MYSDDIMPFLNNAAKGGNDQFGCSMLSVQELVDFINSHQNLAVSGRLLSIKAYSLIVKGYGRVNDEAMLEKTLMDIGDIVVSHPTSEDIVDVVLLNGAMDAYIRCGNSLKCVDLFRYSINPNGESGERNQKLWRCFRSTNIQPNVRTFNTILKAYRDYRGDKQFELSDYLSLLQTMKSFSVVPDAITVNTIVDACVSCGNVSQAKLLLMNLNVDVPSDNASIMLPTELIGTGKVVFVDV